MSKEREFDVRTGMYCLAGAIFGIELRSALVPSLTPGGIHNAQLLVIAALAVVVALGITALMTRPRGWRPVIAILFAFSAGALFKQACVPLEVPIQFAHPEKFFLALGLSFMVISVASRTRQ